MKKQLEDIVAYVGDLIATLSCEVDGAPEPRITWFKDDKEVNVPSIKFDSQYSEGSAELTVKNIEQADAGSYRCRATNALGSVSTEAKMVVEKRKEKTKPSEDGKEKKKTTKVTFRQVSSSFPIEISQEIEVSRNLTKLFVNHAIFR